MQCYLTCRRRDLLRCDAMPTIMEAIDINNITVPRGPQGYIAMMDKNDKRRLAYLDD